MRILVTGSEGFIGQNLVKYLIERDETVWTPGRPLDVTISHFLGQTDAIVHLAAQTSHPVSNSEPSKDLQDNCELTLFILEQVRKTNPAIRVIYPSTTTVIGRHFGFATENTPVNPLDIYSSHKLTCEQYCRIYRELHGLHTLVFRLGNIYGPYGHPEPEYGFLNHFIWEAYLKYPLKIFGKGDQARSVMYVEDVCDLLYRACESNLEGLYNAAGFEHLSVRTIAERIQKWFGARVEYVPYPEGREAIEVGNAFFSPEALIKVWDWLPVYTIDTGLEATREEVPNWVYERSLLQEQPVISVLS